MKESELAEVVNKDKMRKNGLPFAQDNEKDPSVRSNHTHAKACELNGVDLHVLFFNRDKQRGEGRDKRGKLHAGDTIEVTTLDLGVVADRETEAKNGAGLAGVNDTVVNASGAGPVNI